VAKVKYYESDVGSNSELGLEMEINTIEEEPSATITTTKIHPSEPDEPEEGECFFHSQM
jgi:hypothetical protein